MAYKALSLCLDGLLSFGSIILLAEFEPALVCQSNRSVNGTMSNLSLHCLQQANRANTGGRVVLKEQLSVLKIINIFLLKSEKGSNMSLQSKACLPAVKMLLTLKCSMSNVEEFSALSPDLKLLLEIISVSNEIYATSLPLYTVGDTALIIILRNTDMQSTTK